MANALFLRPPMELPTRSAWPPIYTSRDDGRLYGSTSFPDYTSVAEAVDALDGVAATSFDGLKLDDGQRSLLAEMVTGNYFTVLGVRPVLGRTFLPGETVPGRARHVAVIGYDLWQRQFAGDPRVVGRTLRLNGHVHEIVGVAPDGLVSRMLGLRPDVWVPLGIPGESAHRTVAELERRADREFRLIGRLRDGATLADVRAQLQVVETRLRAAYPEAWKDPDGRTRRLSALSERDSRLDPEVRRVFAGIALFFLGAAGLILLIACSNVMGLFLAQAGRRRREIAVRLALGASRRQIVGMLLTEGLVPGLVSGALGLLLAMYATSALETMPLPFGVPMRFEFSPDVRVLAFAVLTSIGASLTFSLVPALQASRPELTPALKSDAAGPSGRRRFSLRNAVVVVQFATTVMLLAGAVLFLRSLQGAVRADFGIHSDRIAIMTRQIPERDGTPAARVAYIRALRARLASLPGVERANVSRGMELTLAQIGTDVRIGKVGAAPSDFRDAFRNAVTPGYLEMLGVPMVRGRTISEKDIAGAPLVAVVNETMARRLWPGEDPIGRRFQLAQAHAFEYGGSETPQAFEVVGVARDGKYVDIDDDAVAYCWTSIYQDDPRLVTLSVKGVESAEAMVPLLREHGEARLDEVPIVAPSALASQISLQFMPLRVAARVLGWGGVFGLLLALVGIYGVVAYSVTTRTREMAIRIAVGASGGQVLGRIVRDALRLAAGGLVLGLAAAAAVAPLMKSLMFGVSPIDPISFGGTAALLAAGGVRRERRARPPRAAYRSDPHPERGVGRLKPASTCVLRGGRLQPARLPW